ncbi:tripartite tricarboxylate transporter TctB family protein [Celeribacter sp.]|uniref:tripartite tricarboxylate transporter TctB family protein n=1 Tax=unclassified Celeribacter TaxID=2618893 RepID=UPI003A9520A7
MSTGIEKSRAIRWIGAGLGAGFALVGLALAVVSYRYGLGSLRQIGPGLMPFIIGAVLMLCGLVAAIVELKAGDIDFVPSPLSPILLVVAGVLIWALTVERLGFVIATVLLMLCTTLAYRPVKWKSSLIVIACMAGFSAVFFIYGFKLPFKLFWW